MRVVFRSTPATILKERVDNIIPISVNRIAKCFIDPSRREEENRSLPSIIINRTLQNKLIKHDTAMNKSRSKVLFRD